MIIFLTMIIILLNPVYSYSNDGERIKPVFVTASRIEENINSIGASISIIPGEELRKRNIINVEEGLRDELGVDVQKSGGFLGSLTDVRIRGANTDQVLVLMDGIPVNDPFTGSFNFSLIPIDNLDRIEIVRGVQSALYGSEGVGGVINIITKKGRGKPKLSLANISGSDDTFKEELSLNGMLSEVDYSLSLSRLDTSGFRPGPFGRTGHNNTSIISQFGYALTHNSSLRLLVRYHDADTEIPFDFPSSVYPSIQIYDPNSKEEEKFLNTTLRFRHNPSKLWDYYIEGAFVHSDYKFDNDEDNRVTFPTISHSNLDTKRFMIEMQNNLHLFKDRDIISFGFEYKKDGAERNDLSNLPSFGFAPPEFTRVDKDRDIKAFFLQNHINIKNILFADIGFRFDHYSDFGSTTNPKVSIAYILKETYTKFRMSYGKGFNAPTLSDLYFPNFGNPDLKEERSENYEFGIEQKLLNNLLLLNVTFFHTDFDNLIGVIPTDTPPFFKVTNVNKAKTQGWEIGFKL